MFFNREKKVPPKKKAPPRPDFQVQTSQIPTYLSVGLTWVRFQFLLICSDGDGQEWATLEAEWDLPNRVFEFKKLSKEFARLSEQGPDAVEAKKDFEKDFDERLTSLYQFCGRMIFELEKDDATAVIAEMEKLMAEEPLLTGEVAYQDMIMGFLLEDFGGLYDRTKVQTEVIDYLRKRWGMDDDRYERLNEKYLTTEDIAVLLDKIKKRVESAAGAPDQAAKRA